jgi:hypothetical protein
MEAIIDKFMVYNFGMHDLLYHVKINSLSMILFHEMIFKGMLIMNDTRYLYTHCICTELLSFLKRRRS